ncbi:unnamed protein product [Blepharisma stoltei]|uniref:PLAC8 motif-containing protein n=1 Tax=Blepharisma stoltei TaxID=1481888 RepID=A0AAU9K4J3_9CILI|nr:unnamed protein product [Blepharisma stoltei]
MSAKKTNWHKTMCDCFDAFPECLLLCCCPVIGTAIVQSMAHKTTGVLNHNLTFILGCTLCCIGCAINRKRFRDYYELEGNFCIDCLLYDMGCYLCLSSQEYMESHWQLQNRKSADTN